MSRLYARDVHASVSNIEIKTHGWRRLAEENGGVKLRYGARHKNAQDSRNGEQCQRVYGCSLKSPSDAVPQVDRDTIETEEQRRSVWQFYMSR